MNNGTKKTGLQMLQELGARLKAKEAPKPAATIQGEAAKAKPEPDANRTRATVQKPATSVPVEAVRIETKPEVKGADQESNHVMAKLCDSLGLRYWYQEGRIMVNDLEFNDAITRLRKEREAASSGDTDASAKVAHRNSNRFLYVGLTIAIGMVGLGSYRIKLTNDGINEDRKTRQAVWDVYRLDPREVPSAIKRLNPEQQKYAAGVFMDAMTAGHAWSRRNAALALGELRAGDSVQHLIEALDDRNHYTVRISAAKSLIKIKGEKAMKAVESVIQNDPDGRVRREVKEAYERSRNK